MRIWVNPPKNHPEGCSINYYYSLRCGHINAENYCMCQCSGPDLMCTLPSWADFALCLPNVFGSAPKVFPKLLNFSQDTLIRHSNPAPVHVCVRVLSCAGIEVDLHHAAKYG